MRMRRFGTGAAVLALGTASMGAAADPAPSTAAVAFGAREYIQHASLSPDGSKIALVTATTGRGEHLVVVDMVAGGEPREISRTTGSPDHYGGCHWSTDRRIVCTIRMTQATGIGRLGFSRVISMAPDGSDLKLLSVNGNGRSLGLVQSGGGVIDRLPGDRADGGVLMTRSFVGEEAVATRLADSRTGLAVERVDTATGRRSIVEPPHENVVEYITDGHGTVRLMGMRPPTRDGYSGSSIRYLYRAKGARDWKPLSTLTMGATGTSQGFDPYAVDRTRDTAIGFDTVDGRKALVETALDGSGKRTVLLARPDVDVDGLIRIGLDRRVVGASFATDARRAELFDPELRTLAASLGRALPGKPIATFVDASADEGKLLMFAGSDTDPGRYYLYDKKTRKLEEVLPVRPQLAGRTLATVKPVSFPAADGTAIPGYLTLPPGSSGRGLPAIVMPHGGPGARDEWNFNWWAQFFAARGFAVLQPNFRGSTGYGDAWFQKNGFQSWRTAVGDVNDAGRWLTAQGIAAPGKLAIVGWSYGGYAALQSPALDADLYKAIVAVAPVTDLDMVREEARNLMSFAMVDRFVGTGPHVEAGSPARHPGVFKAPVLLFHGDQDTNVGIAESRVMADRLRGAGKKVELVEFKGLDHQLNDGAARASMLDKSDAFLRAALGL